VAARRKMSISDTFVELNLETLVDFLDKHVKLIELSATPDGVILDLYRDEEAKAEVDIMKPGEGYVSWFGDGAKVRVEEAQDLTKGTHERLTEVFREYKDHHKYHIVRVDTRNKYTYQDNFIKSCGISDYYTIDYDQDSNKKNKYHKDINTILEKRPKKHTYVFVKEMFRCSKTLTKTHIGIMYERITKTRNDSVFSQGLIGRALGYEENKDIVVFTHTDSLERYEKMYDNKFSIESIQSAGWRSNTTTVVRNTTVSTETFQRFGATHMSRGDMYPFESRTIHNLEDFNRFCDLIKYNHQMLEKWDDNDRVYKMFYDGVTKMYTEKEYKDNDIININTGIGKRNKYRSEVYYKDDRPVFVVKYRNDVFVSEEANKIGVPTCRH
jgi:hypothetical protein